MERNVPIVSRALWAWVAWFPTKKKKKKSPFFGCPRMKCRTCCDSGCGFCCGPSSCATRATIGGCGSCATTCVRTALLSRPSSRCPSPASAPVDERETKRDAIDFGVGSRPKRWTARNGMHPTKTKKKTLQIKEIHYGGKAKNRPIQAEQVHFGKRENKSLSKSFFLYWLNMISLSLK